MTLKVLVACEFSGRVRDAFAKKGCDAWSCDLLPSESPGNHIQGDVLEILDDGWDLMVAHPDCTHLAVSGARHFAEKRADGRQRAAIDFFMKMANAPIARICVENPVCIMSSVWRKPDQIIQPYYFGHPETKKTCLWLKNLPPLPKTNVVEPQYIIGKKDGKRYSPVHYASAIINGEERWKMRSRTYQGIADAMAETWGLLEPMKEK